MLLVAVDLLRVACVAAVQGARQKAPQRHIQHKAGGHAEHHLQHHQQQQTAPEARLGGKQGDSLVAGGDKHRQQRAGGDDPAGVQVGGHGGKTALGHAAQRRAGHKTPAPAAGQRLFDALAVVALQPLDEQIGQKQERQHLAAVDKGVDEGVQKKFHKYLLVTQSCAAAAPRRAPRGAGPGGGTGADCAPKRGLHC